MSRSLSVLLFCLVLVTGAGYGVAEVILRPEAPPVTEWRARPAPRLAQHVLFLIVDGLRYDIATDPALMPRFSEAMKQHSSGEIWAGQVSMTTSAVMTYGTGQRGQLEQIVRNLNAAPVPFNSWLQNARAEGRRVMLVGDPAWDRMYEEVFDEIRLDPKGVSIDTNYDEQTFRDTRELLALKPDILISHFVTPDHQGHAYGIHSEKYKEYIVNYDRLLSELLGEVGPEWTVIVTSDHGAADSGTHGADVAVQRRSPIYAYGPGIAKGFRAEEKLDQVDMPGTFAALLGVSGARESRGHLLVDFLDLDSEDKAKLACEDAERAFAYGVARLGSAAQSQLSSSLEVCRSGSIALEKRQAASELVRFVDSEIQRTTGLRSSRTFGVLSLVLLASALLAGLCLGRGLWPGAPLAVALAIISVALVYYTERLSGHGPNIVRVSIFIAANLLTLWVLVRPLSFAGFLEGNKWLAPSLLPGLLVYSYPSNTHPQSYVALAVIGLLFGLLGPLGSPKGRSDGWQRLKAHASALSAKRLAFLGLALVILFFPGVKKDSHFPAWLISGELWPLIAALLLVGVWGVSTRVDGWGRGLFSGRSLAVDGLLLAVSLVAKGYVPHQLGRLCLVVFPVLAGIFLFKKNFRWAIMLALVAFAWVSRSREWLGLIPTLIVAEAAGDAWRARQQEARDSEPDGTLHEVRRHAPGYADLVLASCFVFGLVFVQRMGIQGHIDFGSMDLAAGAFGDPHVPLWVVGGALAWKYILAEIIVIGAFVGRLDSGSQRRLLPVLVVMYVGRFVMLLSQLVFCGGSYWTGFRVLGDLPFALTGLVAAGLCYFGISRLSSGQLRPGEAAAAAPLKPAA